jgi:hypothetical protein
VEENMKLKHLHKENKSSEDQSKEDTKKPYLHLKANSEDEHLQGCYKGTSMKMFSMFFVSHVMNMVTRHWIEEIMQGKMLEM